MDLSGLLLFIILAINPMGMTMKKAVVIFTGMWLAFGMLTARSQTVEGALEDRLPVVAGQFYPEDKGALTHQLSSYFESLPSVQSYDSVAALVAPHAGYRYSGKVAAAAYQQLDPDRSFINIFILAPSHRVQFKGASLYSKGHYQTPLGQVKVNLDLVNKLIRENDVFSYQQEAHKKEHSLEVQLPFLQHHLNRPFKIVPIITGTHDLSEIREMAGILKPYFNGENLFVISTDFSHYPTYQQARKVDSVTAEAVVQNSPAALIRTIRSNASQEVANLATSMCGWPGMMTLLHMSPHKGSMDVRKLLYQNSGDVTGDHSRVVGYWAMAFIRNHAGMSNTSNMDFQIKEEDKRSLLQIARTTLRRYVREKEVPPVDEQQITEQGKVHTGAFVTLYKDGELRGCVGRFNPNMPLYQVVRDMAVASCSEDLRFSPVEPSELDDISIEISVLTPMRKISSPEEIELGQDGIYIKKGPFAGTLLPQVAEKTGWTREEFLGHCAREKAGIGWEGWKNADVFTYRAIVFHEVEKEKNR
jgi:AmmeMemoRadiSam system protein B/AmmeMemoRadiSam system protein A